MRSQAVLVLGTYANRNLIEVLFNIGFSPLVREDIQGALTKLRHEQFTAIVVDRKYANTDVLEFVLNVRDIDKEIPVVVLGKLTDEAVHRTLQNQNQTIVVEEIGNTEKLAEKLEQILTSPEGSINDQKDGYK